MAEKYSIIWASVICGAHNFLCLLPLWDRALQRWRMSSWYFSATLTMGTMTMLVIAPQLHRQWGHCGTILGYHSKFLVLKTATCDYTKVDGDLCLSNRVSQNNALLWFFHPRSKKRPWNDVHLCRTVQITAQHCQRHYRPGCGLL